MKFIKTERGDYLNPMFIRRIFICKRRNRDSDGKHDPIAYVEADVYGGMKPDYIVTITDFEDSERFSENHEEAQAYLDKLVADLNAEDNK